MKIDFLRLAASVSVCQLAGIVGSVFTFQSIPTWYAALAKPWFSPPNWVFAPAWISLYAMMGIALYLVWQAGLEKKEVRIAGLVFFVQLALNALWSIIFFGLQNPALAFAEIVLLWASIAACVFAFWKVSKPAALLLLPYLVWVSFAAVLNYSIMALNA